MVFYRIFLVTLLATSALARPQQEPNNDLERIQEVNLRPEQVQEYLARQNTDIQLATRINTLEVPRSSPDGEDQVEDVYLAKQYHGQDGLGRYLYGYSDPNSAKVEARNQEGKLRGSYLYTIPGSQEVIEVHYWDDGKGFHQTDNIPVVLPQQVEDTEEVKAAKLEHERLWKEAAAAAKVSPVDIALVRAEEQQQAKQLTYRDPEFYNESESQQQPVTERKLDFGEEQDGTTSEPRGFFYSFLYPAGVRYNKQEYEIKRLRDYPQVAKLA